MEFMGFEGWVYFLSKNAKRPVFYQFLYLHMISYGNIYQCKQFGRKMNAFKNFRGDKMLDLISVIPALKESILSTWSLAESSSVSYIKI